MEQELQRKLAKLAIQRICITRSVHHRKRPSEHAQLLPVDKSSLQVNITDMDKEICLGMALKCAVDIWNDCLLNIPWPLLATH